ncbi:hypothetical protein [Bacillus sp. T33-2]|uniref:hypothetical protein n=1 Tax=Bacillus sp. T33-2 TaxID=2054168 RepID=UPI001C60C772|nr:hypothetical protein [Bacillus sp. T33-2]
MNMTNKNRFYIKEVTLEELNGAFTCPSKDLLKEEKERTVKNESLVAVAVEIPKKNFLQFLLSLFKRK